MNEPVLDLDVGNTRLKFRFWKEGGVTSEGAIPHAEADLGSSELSRHAAPARVRIASVAGPEILEPLLEFCRSRWSLEPEVAHVRDSCAGVRQGYTDSRRLGVDRWLAVLAAFNCTRTASVVVSCGTAITVDLVTADGRHRGGYIVPGFNLMRSALFSGTSAVRLDRVEPPETLAPGRDTIAAVNRGLVLMVKSFVESAEREIGGSAKSAIVLTGGDGELLLPFLKEGACSTNVQYRPNLVLDGLALALP
jgi:type III pantothenate kinase